MASLVVKAMEQDGLKVLMGCVPKCVSKDEKSGRLTVSWTTPSLEDMCDQFDTVLMAAGKSLYMSSAGTEMAAQCGTSWIVKRWRWVSFGGKMREVRVRSRESYNAKNWNLWATFLLQTLRVSLQYCLGEIMQNNSHYVVQSHSRSRLFVPIRRLYVTSYEWVIHVLAAFPRFHRLLAIFLLSTGVILTHSFGVNP